MAESHPFRGVRYNQSLVNDLDKVICLPYDIITPQMQQELYHRSEHNFVRVEFTRDLPQSTEADNKYTRSAATLEQWLKQGVLKVDKVPALYLHDGYFTIQGKEYKRRGIICCVRLEEWDEMVVRPHEGTLAEPKGDRLSLLWALQANTSPILAMYEDPGRQVSSLLSVAERSQPIISIGNGNGESHKVWAITAPEVINQICRSLTYQPLYIADGHHRYESALTYRREKLSYSSSSTGDEAFNFVMMTLVDFSDPGLVILSPHRLVRGLSQSNLSGLMAKLATFFEVELLPLSLPDVWQQVDDLLTGVRLEETKQVRVILFGLAEKTLLVLKLRDQAAANLMMPYFHSALYKGLDVSIVDHIILEKLLGLGSGPEEAILDYSYDRLDAVQKVLDEEYQLAFLVRPIGAEVIKAIADEGDRMPRKSTYFYPKLPSGLVLYRFI
ncbi:DUF1015 domain-containing protein [Chloroflexota bacterium]